MSKRMQTGGRIVRFVAVGVSNTAIDFGVLNLLVFLAGATAGAGLILCNAAAFLAASLNSYFWNKRWTFQEQDAGSPGQYLLFFAFTFGGMVVNSTIIYLLIELYQSGISPATAMQVNLAKVIATLGSMTWNYLTYRHLVFRGFRSRQTA